MLCAGIVDNPKFKWDCWANLVHIGHLSDVLDLLSGTVPLWVACKHCPSPNVMFIGFWSELSELNKSFLWNMPWVVPESGKAVYGVVDALWANANDEDASKQWSCLYLLRRILCRLWPLETCQRCGWSISALLYRSEWCIATYLVYLSPLVLLRVMRKARSGRFYKFLWVTATTVVFT
jgi:hypothetical protein